MPLKQEPVLRLSTKHLAKEMLLFRFAGGGAQYLRSMGSQLRISPQASVHIAKSHSGDAGKDYA